MTDFIRLELTGKRNEAWNRVFDSLTNVIERAIENLAPDAKDETKDAAKQLTQDLSELTKGWVKAKLDRPVLENEKTIADIAQKFEELKVSQARREQIEVETDIKRVELEEKRLKLWEQRMTMAIRWLGFLQNHIVRSDDGSVALLLTNKDLSTLLLDVRSLKELAERECSD